MTEVEGEQEHEKMRERLARIEANQDHLGKQLDRMIQQGERVLELLDRLVRVEEHVAEYGRGQKRLYTRLEVVEMELETWRSARRIISWGFAGVAAAAAVVVAMVTHE